MSFIYTLSTDIGVIGLNDRSKPYVIGFKNSLYAYKIRDVVHQKPEIYLRRGRIESVQEDVIFGLKTQYGITSNIPEITIDMDAEIEIPKKKKDTESLVLNINRLENDEFIMYPFTKGTGVILPQKLIFEDDLKYIFKTQVIDPAESIDIFRQGLDIK